MRKSIAIIAALGLLSTSLTPVVAAPANTDVVKSDDLSAAPDGSSFRKASIRSNILPSMVG